MLALATIAFGPFAWASTLEPTVLQENITITTCPFPPSSSTPDVVVDTTTVFVTSYLGLTETEYPTTMSTISPSETVLVTLVGPMSTAEKSSFTTAVTPVLTASPIASLLASSATSTAQTVPTSPLTAPLKNNAGVGRYPGRYLVFAALLCWFEATLLLGW